MSSLPWRGLVALPCRPLASPLRRGHPGGAGMQDRATGTGPRPRRPAGRPEGQRHRQRDHDRLARFGFLRNQRALHRSRCRPATPARPSRSSGSGHETGWTWAPTAHVHRRLRRLLLGRLARQPHRALRVPGGAPERLGPASREPRRRPSYGHRLPARDRHPVRPGLLRHADRLRRQA